MVERDSPEDRGAAAVELAMTALLLILLVVGIFELGRTLYILVGLHEAAQEGAIYGSFEPADADAIRDRVKDSISFPELQDENVTVSCPNGVGGPPAAGGDLVAVTVDYDVDLIAPFISQWLGGSISLSREFIGEVFIGDCVPTTS